MINIALFGLGRIGYMHAQNLAKHGNFNLKYVYDIDKNLANPVCNTLVYVIYYLRSLGCI